MRELVRAETQFLRDLSGGKRVVEIYDYYEKAEHSLQQEKNSHSWKEWIGKALQNGSRIAHRWTNTYWSGYMATLKGVACL